MKKIIITLIITLLSTMTLAAESIELLKAKVDLNDHASLKRGAEHYVSYCLGCHSTKYIRYLRLARDFEVPEEEILQGVAPSGAGIYDKMLNAMNSHDANKWFGIEPPDLSLVARSRGADWINTYLRSFYNDTSKPLGTNNTVFPDVGMPNMLWQLQGEQNPVYVTQDQQKKIAHLTNDGKGTLSPQEFDQFVNDLVNFLVYVSEPTQVKREAMGKYVLFFILMFTVIAYLLKKEYWRDVH